MNINSESKIPRIKVVTVGDAGVGKTCLTNSCITGTYRPEMTSTIGARYCSSRFSIENEQFIFDIWDTAGQERFHSLLPMYYRSANIILICLDLSRQYDESRLEYWLERINSHADISRCIVFLVGTKSDIACADYQETEETIMMNPATARYETFPIPTILKSICSRNNLLYKPTSALKGEGISELFTYSAMSILQMLQVHSEDIVDINETISWRDWVWGRVTTACVIL